MSDAEELTILGQTLDMLEGLKSRESKIAGLRCFVRGLQGKGVLQEDVELIALERGGGNGE